MVINIQAKIDLDAMSRNSTAIMAAIDAGLPKLLEQVASSKHWVTTFGNLDDSEGKPVGELVVSLSPR